MVRDLECDHQLSRIVHLALPPAGPPTEPIGADHATKIQRVLVNGSAGLWPATARADSIRYVWIISGPGSCGSAATGPPSRRNERPLRR